MDKPRLECRFYRNDAGAEPVREWLRGQQKETRLAIGSDIKAIQWRWPVSKPLVGTFGAGLYEVRTSVGDNIYRVFFCVRGSTMVLLHAFMKKTQKTPQRELDTARRRQKDVEETP